MNRELYACIHAAEFPAQALLRLRTDLQSQPVAVLEGRAPQQTVCALNRHARLRGAVLGMTRLEAEGINGLLLLPRSTEVEISARGALLECAAMFSPRIEEIAEVTAFGCVLDIAGTERLFGPSESLAERLRAALAAAGFRASIAVSANYEAACMKAAATRGITVIPEGDEACALAKLPVAALNLAEEHQETFALWGIRTLGELAALPEIELVTRLGPQARTWHERARGVAKHIFQPREPIFSLQEFCEFETPVEQMESLLFIGARMIDCLSARAAGRALSLSSLSLNMRLDGGGVHHGTIRPALPTTDRKFLLKLLQLEIGAHPPPAAVVSLALHAEAGQSPKMQLGLFAPQTPELFAAGYHVGAAESSRGRESRWLAGAGRYTSRRQLPHGRFFSQWQGIRNCTSEPADCCCGASGRLCPFTLCCTRLSRPHSAIGRTASMSWRHSGRGAAAAPGGPKTNGMRRNGMCWLPAAMAGLSLAFWFRTGD